MGLASFRLPWADFLFPKNEIAIIANRFLIKKKSSVTLSQLCW